MKHLFKDWVNAKDRIQRCPSLFFFLDYDGTLTPIVSRPELALCPLKVRRLLEKLRDNSRVQLAIISGRSLEDIRNKVGIDGITYVGNHGLDIQNPVGRHEKKLSAWRQKEFGKITQTLRESLGEIQGVLFEDKGSILAVHYRNVARKYFARLQRGLQEVVAKWEGRWKIASGKMVWEIRPNVDFNKGKAVSAILKSFPARGLLPIYFGDDQTDEDAFAVIKGKGITVFVGPGSSPSVAEYYLDDPLQVQEFLKRCLDILQDSK